MSRFTIRSMHAADIPTVVEMIDELTAFHDDTGTVSIASVTRDTTGPAPWWHVFVAEAAGQLIGYLVLLPNAKVADGLRGIDLDHMYVREPHRGTGVGRAFIDTAKDYALANACTYLVIGTAQGNIAAQTAYEACGFVLQPSSTSPRLRMQL